MTATISRPQVEQYLRDGVLFPLPALSANEVTKFRMAFATLESRLGSKPKHRQLIQPHLCYRWAYDLATHPAILDVIEAIIGPDILVHSTSLFPKYPHDNGYISWHQDGYYWGLNTPDLISAWVALTNSNLENGCVRVVAGSHTNQVLPHAHSSTEKSTRLSLEIAVEVDEAEALDVELKAGQMSLHHPYLIHGSKPNQTDEMRIGFAIRFVASHVKQSLLHHAVVLARGRNEHHHFELLQEPPTNDIEKGILTQAKIADWIDTIPRTFQ